MLKWSFVIRFKFSADRQLSASKSATNLTPTLVVRLERWYRTQRIERKNWTFELFKNKSIDYKANESIMANKNNLKPQLDSIQKGIYLFLNPLGFKKKKDV